MFVKKFDAKNYNSFEYINIKQELFRRLLVIAAVATFLISIINLVNRLDFISIMIPLISSLLCLLLYKLSKPSKNNLIIQIIYFTFFNVVFIPLGWFTSPGSISAMPLYALLIMTLSMAFIEKLWGFIFPLISLIEVVLLFQYERFHPSALDTYPTNYSRLYDLTISFIVISVISFIVFWTINNFIEKERKILYDLSVTDPLTNLYNRRFLIDSMEAYVNLAKRKQEKFSILIIDINNFKALNDTYGHIEGDKALRYLGNLLLTNSRNYDICGRYGGDEFIVLMPKSTYQNSSDFAQRVLLLFNEFAKEYSKVELSFSFGISEDCGNDMDTFVLKADKDLYNMKKNKYGGA